MQLQLWNTIAVFSLFKVLNLLNRSKVFWLIITRMVKICKYVFKIQNSTFISIECTKIYNSIYLLTTQCHKIGSLYEPHNHQTILGSVFVSIYICIY